MSIITFSKMSADDIFNHCDADSIQRTVKMNTKVFKDIVAAMIWNKEHNVKEVGKVAVIAYCKENRVYYLIDGKHTTTAARMAGYTGKFQVKHIICNTQKEVAETIVIENTNIPFSTAKKFALDFEVREFLKPIGDQIVAMGLVEKFADEKEEGMPYQTLGDMLCSYIERDIYTDKKERHNMILRSTSQVSGFLNHMRHLSGIKKAIMDQKGKKKFNEISFLIGFSATGRLSYNEYLDVQKRTVSNITAFSKAMSKVARGSDKPKEWRRLFINIANN